MVIKPIRTAANYRTALARVEAIFLAQPGDPEFDELDVLTTLIEAYESHHEPIIYPRKQLDSILNWLHAWYSSMCDDEWEFREGIKIFSTSNPGWSVEINLEGTIAEEISISPILTKNSNDDWHGILVENGMFIGSGDPSKLAFLLTRFKTLVETGR
ncbi:Imm53 family immunity protein [Hymenobacter sp. PAMC 26628]|uniref:Imm53 family immunity protein n=1 Tax=Hymenobacter sp. PAMC 26628 TaxID=1484118 RepID=UPI0012FFB9AB|nr:Imm53 family immunity protein [Hymenobacter sp. PAMC 26628]